MTGTRRIGVTYASLGVLGGAGIADIACAAKDLGYSSFWTAETVGLEGFATLTAAGAAAPGLDLGTGVLALQLRTPMLTAMGAATIQALHPDVDVLLGVGISSPVVTERWHGVPYGERPLSRTREFLTLVRECLSGESVSFDGDHYRASRFRLGVRLGERRPKIVLGALNDRMLRLAGELADGVLLNYLPATAVPWCVEQVRKGEAAAGRDPGSCTVYGYVHVTAGDRASALESARKDLFSYAVVEAYGKAFTRAGFGDDIGEVRARHAAGDREGVVAAVSDAMVDAINVIGDHDHVAATVRSYVEAGVEVPVIMPMPWGDDRRQVVGDTIGAAIDGGRIVIVQDSVVVITGGASGIGAAMANAFVREGARAIVIADVADGSPVADRLGDSVRFERCDVSDRDDVEELVSRVEREVGPIDLFCANAGIGTGAGVDAPDEVWSRIWSVNVMGIADSASAYLPRGRERGRGHLLVTASAAGLLTNLGDAPYTATKHAAVGLAEWLAITHGPDGLTVQCLCPQGVRTPMVMGGLDDDMLAAEVVEAQGLIEPDECAAAVVAGLATDEFLILPHPEVRDYLRTKVEDPGRWFGGMRKLQARLTGG